MRTLLLILLFLSTPAWATTWYIRSDGSNDTNCTGTTDAAYVSGVGQPCAFSHNYYLTGWYIDGNAANKQGTMHMAGGDTVKFSKSGDSFKQGYDAAWTGCNAAYKYECYPQPWPAGTAPAHTKIYGYGGDTGATTINTTLYGAGGIPEVLFFGAGDNPSQDGAATNYVDVYNLELTDHEQCESGGTSPPTSCADNATDGINGKGVSNITLHYLNIHGVARYGISMPGATAWTFDHVTIRNNGYGGITNDDGTGSGLSLTGAFTMTNSTIDFNGCGESYPGLDTADCWGQDASHGGYGDGIGFASGNIGQWTITDSSISHNTQDGFDGKHGVHTGDYLYSARNRYEGNAGQQMKMESPLTSENDFFVGDCNFFSGKSYTFSGFTNDDMCRASGNTFELGVTADEVHKIYGATILSFGDVALLLQGSGCNSSTKLQLRNSVVQGGRQWHDDSSLFGGGGDDTASFFYTDDAGSCAGSYLDEDYNQVYGFKEGVGAISGSHSRVSNPQFSGSLSLGPTTYSNADDVRALMYLSSTSPARYSVTGANTADETVSCTSDCSIDYNSVSRGSNYDGGAVQYAAGATSGITGKWCGRFFGTLK